MAPALRPHAAVAGPASTLLLLVGLLLGAGCVRTPPVTSATLTRAPECGPDTRYFLPFVAGTQRLCLQAHDGPFSHHCAERYAVDFAMPEGTPVLAARDGRVVGVKEDSDTGGSSREHADEGNYVRILHADGTRAVYLHLQKDGAAVRVGQTVRRGEVVGYAGDTGWSAMPHLHFHVESHDPETGAWCSVPVSFADVRGDGVPQMLLVYESGNVPR